MARRGIRGLGRAALGAACVATALGGELALEGRVGVGFVRATGPGSVTLVGSMGEVVADSLGAVSATGRQIQAGEWVRQASWNRPPSVGWDSVTRPKGQVRSRISAATLLANDQDPDGDALTIVAVEGATPAGATVMLEGTDVVYEAPVGDAGNGGFRYVVADGAGGNRSRGWVAVLEEGPDGVEERPHALGLEVSWGDRVVLGTGSPGVLYRVQYAVPSLGGWEWQDFEPMAWVTAGVGEGRGLFRYVDVSPGDDARLYRAMLAP